MNTLKRLLEFFEDGEYLSSYRLLMISWGLGVLLLMFVLSLFATITTGTPVWVAPPISVLTFLGSLVAGKQLQNYTENQREKDQKTN